MEEAQIVINVEASMQHELDTLWGNMNEAKNFTIFRTPHNISQSKKNLFEPSAISIGPFHRGQDHLRALEEQKWRFLRDFLSRGDHISLNLCISEMKSLEERTRRCYSEKFDDLKSKAFVEMMLLDGCFVLEYLLKFYEGNADSLFEVGWNYDFIDRDLLLLENQIPFFIVEKLYEIGNLSLELPRMIYLKFLPRSFLFEELIDEIPDPPAEIYHLVHLCYHYLVPYPEKLVVYSNRTINWFCSRPVALQNSTGNISSMVIPSASELKNKGLIFKPKSNPKHMLDISFEHGVLQIPRLAITAENKAILTNLVAFEHSKYGKDHLPFTSFVIFLDNLVNTPNDVTILQECGIIENWLGSEEELTHFINQVTEGAAIGNRHYLAELYTEVNKFSASNRDLTIYIPDFYSNPWAITSLIGAFILLVLTVVQSFFTVFAYFVPPSS